MSVYHLITGLLRCVWTCNDLQPVRHVSHAEFLHVACIDGIRNTEVFTCRYMGWSRYFQVLGNSIYADAHQYHQDDSKPTYMFHIYYLITNYILYLINEYLKRQSYQFLSYTFRRGWLIAFCILRFVAFSCWIAAFKSCSALSRLIFS